VITVYPIGTTIYRPEGCYNGYTVLCFPLEEGVFLVDMNGNVVNEWGVQAIRAKLLRDGNLLVVERRRTGRNRVLEFSWDDRPVWEYEPPGPAHHDVERLENGNTLLLYQEVVPEEYRKRIRDPRRRSARTPGGVGVVSDVVLEVTPKKEVAWEWHEYEHLNINRYCEICLPHDWTHTNTVQTLPENRWFEAGDERFRPGNVLISLRNLSAIFIVDRETKEIVWEYTGDYDGGLAGQHEPHMVEKGLPGEGNIIIFDNGAPPLRALRHSGQSYVLEVEPPTKRLVWRYENGENFNSKFRSNVQRLPNGNTLICSSEGPRVFEVTREGEIVWEYAVPGYHILGRSYRYPYDYCPQLKALRKPREDPVVPPPHVITKPYHTLRPIPRTGLPGTMR